MVYVFLGILGFAIAQSVWREHGPVWGLLTGVLFVGGLGWRVLFFLIAAPFKGSAVGIDKALVRSEAKSILIPGVHVALREDGKGATFTLHRRDGELRWTWRFDDELAESGFWFIPVIEMAIYRMDQQLGIQTQPTNDIGYNEPAVNQKSIADRLPFFPWDGSQILANDKALLERIRSSR